MTGRDTRHCTTEAWTSRQTQSVIFVIFNIFKDRSVPINHRESHKCFLCLRWQSLVERSAKQIGLQTFDHRHRINLDHVCTRTKYFCLHHKHIESTLAVSPFPRPSQFLQSICYFRVESLQIPSPCLLVSPHDSFGEYTVN